MIKLIFLISALLLCNTYSSSVGESCTNSNECMQLNHCADSSNICVHDSIFPITFDTILGLIFVVFGSALSNAGGIGGGGLLIPILLLIFKFYTHEAIPISKLMIFSGAVTSFVLGFKQKHPFRDTITIDYNIPLLLVPMVLFGTMVGVTMNKVTPPWIILISLTLVLIINTYKTLQKGKALYLEEKRQLSSPRELGVLHEEDEHRSGGNNREHSRNEREKDKISDSVEIHEKSTLQSGNTIEEYSLIRKEEIKDQRKCPFDKLIYMIICYVMMLLINFLKGSEHINSIIDIEVCTPPYWGIYFLYFPFASFITYLVSRKIKKEYAYRQSINYPYNNQDIKWSDNKVFWKFPLYAFVSGVMAGMLGIGGGLILGPLLLQLGLHPIVSTATSNFLVLFTSSSTSIQFIILGMMNLDYGIACTIASSIGSFMGTILIQKLLNYTKRNSYLIFALGSVLAVSTLLIPAHTFINLIEQINNGKNIWRFNSPC